MNKIIQFGETVEGYNIPVLNEREIRASAGILFLAVFISLVLILSDGNFVPIKYVISLFLTDFLIRIFINPKFSPILIISRLIVRNQVPEYVGAQQKKFAWMVGLVLSATMFIFLVVINTFSPITGIICLVCLILMFFETAFGICIGCIVYKMIYKEKAQYCPGEACDVKSRQSIQKTSGSQLLIVLGFVALIFVVGSLFNQQLSKKPHNLFAINNTTESK